MKFNIKFISYFLLYFIMLPLCVAQSTEKDKLVLQEIEIFKSLANEQIIKERKISDKHRDSMLKLIKKLDYTEAFIIGVNREFWHEGLSDKFTGSPKQVLIKHNSRNQLTVQLENTHVELYESDSRLLIWKNFKSQCSQMLKGENIKFFRDINKVNNFSSSQKIKIALLFHLLEQVDRESGYPHNTKSLTNRNRRINIYEEYFETKDFTSLDSLVEKAYPYDGQINFFRDEFVRSFGYILLKKGYQKIVDSKLAIRWIDESGKTLDKKAHINYLDHVITFDLPKSFFKPGSIYKYKILKLPHKVQDKLQCKYEILDDTLTNILAEYLPNQTLSGKVIYKAQFRCSHYESFIDKIDAIVNQDLVLNEDLKIILELSEPFSDFEIYGDDTFESQLELSTKINSNVVYPDGLYSFELKRILTTPKDLSVDTFDLSDSMESLVKKYNEIKGVNEMKYYSVNYLKELNLDEVEMNSEIINSIVIDDYLSRSRFDKSYTYELSFPMLDSLSQVFTRAQQALKDRIFERAAYFRLIDIKIKKLENDPTRHPIKYYTDLEYAKLSDKMRKFLNSKMNLRNKWKCSLDLIYHLPGLDQKSSIFTIKFDLSENID